MLLLYCSLLILIYYIFQQLIVNELSSQDTSKVNQKSENTDIIAYLSLPHQQLQSFEIPQYKFFSEIIAKLLLFRTKYGCELATILKEIKKAIAKDKAKVKKIDVVKKQAIIQMVTIIMITLIFHLLACSLILEIPLDYTFLIKFILWNILGMMLFRFTIFHLEKKLFTGFESLFASLYIVKSLFSISRPVNEVVKYSQLLECPSAKSYCSVLAQAKKQFENIKTCGSYDHDHWNMLIQELWETYDDQMERFKKLVKVSMAVVLLIFALPSYLMSILNLIENLSLMA